MVELRYNAQHETVDHIQVTFGTSSYLAFPLKSPCTIMLKNIKTAIVEDEHNSENIPR